MTSSSTAARTPRISHSRFARFPQSTTAPTSTSKPARSSPSAYTSSAPTSFAASNADESATPSFTSWTSPNSVGIDLDPRAERSALSARASMRFHALCAPKRRSTHSRHRALCSLLAARCSLARTLPGRLLPHRRRGRRAPRQLRMARPVARTANRELQIPNRSRFNHEKKSKYEICATTTTTTMTTTHYDDDNDAAARRKTSTPNRLCRPSSPERATRTIRPRSL